MKRRADLFAEALALPEAARFELAAALLESTPPPGALSEDDPRFAEEIRRRVDELQRGDVKGIPWEEARAEVVASVTRTNNAARRRPAARSARSR